MKYNFLNEKPERRSLTKGANISEEKHVLTQPLTVEDWRGQVLLVVPRTVCEGGEEYKMETVFKSPRRKVGRCQGIRRMLVGEDAKKDDVEGLSKAVKEQMGLTLDFSSVRVFKMGRGVQKQLQKDEISSYESSDYSNKHHRNSELMLHKLLKKHRGQRKSGQEINTNSSATVQQDLLNKLKNHHKFTFFTCWCINDFLGENYFILPYDNIDNFSKISQESSDRIRNCNKSKLEKIIKLIEKRTECRIKFRPIVQSRRVSQLLYRKIIIYSKDKKTTSNILHLLKKNVANMIKNSVFYEPLPELTTLIGHGNLSKFKSQSENLNYAHEENITEHLCTFKTSKIPIPFKNKRHHKVTNNVMKEYQHSSCKNRFSSRNKNSMDNHVLDTISHGIETIQASLLI